MAFSGHWRLAGRTANFRVFCIKELRYWQLTKNPAFFYFGLKNTKTEGKNSLKAFLSIKNARNIMKLLKNICKRLFFTL